MLWSAPVLWLLFSASVSAGAVWWVGRIGGPAAAALLAVDPLQIAYAGEINNYPLLVFWVALILWTSERVLKGRGVKSFVAVGILAGWTHLLGAVIFGVALVRVFLRDRRLALRAGAVWAVCLAPVAWRVMQLVGDGGTYGQTGLDWGQVAAGIHQKAGWWVVLVLPAGFAGVRLKQALGGMALALLCGILALISLGIAAPHQQPYWLVLGPFVALLVASIRGPLPWVLAGAGLLTVGPDLLSRSHQLRSEITRERAVDRVLEEAGAADALWLVSPALEPDDDKRATSDVLWRFSPFSSAPSWRGPDNSFDFADPRYGHPREFGGRIVHSSVDVVQGRIEEGCQRIFEEADAFRKAVGWHLDAGRNVWVVLYDHGPACDMMGGLKWAMEPFSLRDLSPEDPSQSCRPIGEDRGLGRDWYCVIEGGG